MHETSGSGMSVQHTVLNTAFVCYSHALWVHVCWPVCDTTDLIFIGCLRFAFDVFYLISCLCTCLLLVTAVVLFHL